MIKKLSAFSLIFLTIFTTQAKNNFPQPGFICVPVADLLAEKINSYKLANSTTQAYNTIPLSWGPAEKNRRFFPRVHQALLHETVTVLAQDNDECLIEIHNAFSLPEGKRTPQATYWTHKKNIRLFSQLPDTSQATELLPSAVSFKNNVIDNTYVATLKMPFFDSAMQQAYSAGTRFKIATRRSTQVTVNVYNISSGKFTTLNLPRNLCHIEKYAQGFLSHTASVNEFIALLRRWTHLPEGFIPLVWGGCSFKDIAKQTAFTLEHMSMPNHKQFSYWKRSDCRTTYSGFDASGLILRATQICGIPYFAKNSATAQRCLQPVTIAQDVQDGDILWFPGFIGVISSVKENKLIGALSYTWGYGKVFEAPLAQFFNNITTVADLYTAQHTHTPLECLDSAGQVKKTVKEFKVLKLQSAWQFTVADIAL